MKKIIGIFLLIALVSCDNKQEEKVNQEDKKTLRAIYDHALENGMSYQWLSNLCLDIGPRLSGSKAAEDAVEWGENELLKLKLDSVWKQPVMVPHWVRGEKEEAYIIQGNTKINVPICALGGSVATDADGLTAEVIEVQSVKEVDSLGDKVKGKIVFYNRPMQVNLIRTFHAYGGCVGQRYNGARVAAKHGAVGAIVRSMNLRQDDYPHTGVMSYGDLTEDEKIPTAAISTNAANMLSGLLAKDAALQFYFKQSCETLPDKPSHNVVGEIKGSEFPEEIILVGGHLDSWDLSQGAQDDGAGVVQSMEVLRQFKELGIQPKRTLRVVLFMNEENGTRGAKKYLELAKKNNENHIVALESDAGGFTPRGFGITCSDANFNKILSWEPLFKPYLIHQFDRGGGGADVNPLKTDDNIIMGLRPDSQRYFDYHHTPIDNLDVVNKRELELGAATMTSLLYLLDKYGIE